MRDALIMLGIALAIWLPMLLLSTEDNREPELEEEYAAATRAQDEQL